MVMSLHFMHVSKSNVDCTIFAVTIAVLHPRAPLSVVCLSTGSLSSVLRRLCWTDSFRYFRGHLQI